MTFINTGVTLINASIILVNTGITFINTNITFVKTSITLVNLTCLIRVKNFAYLGSLAAEFVPCAAGVSPFWNKEQSIQFLLKSSKNLKIHSKYIGKITASSSKHKKLEHEVTFDRFQIPVYKFLPSIMGRNPCLKFYDIGHEHYEHYLWNILQVSSNDIFIIQSFLRTTHCTSKTWCTAQRKIMNIRMSALLQIMHSISRNCHKDLMRVNENAIQEKND